MVSLRCSEWLEAHQKMILELFGVFILLSVSLIGFGIFKPDESYLAIVGFILLFFLGIVLLNNTIEIKSGERTNTTTTQTAINETTTVQTVTNMSYSYGSPDTHRIGYWITILSVLGVGIVLYTIRRHKPK